MKMKTDPPKARHSSERPWESLWEGLEELWESFGRLKGSSGRLWESSGRVYTCWGGAERQSVDRIRGIPLDPGMG